MLYDYRTSQDSGIHTIRMWGELVDRAQAGKMVDFINEQLENRQLKFIFDMNDLKYMNSSGLNVLINLFTRIRKEGGEMVITNVNKKIQELLIITKLTTLFTVTDTLEKAKQKLAAA